MTAPLLLAIPSKGRLMDDTLAMLTAAGLPVTKADAARGYSGRIEALDGVEVAFLSATEIAHHLRDGKVHMGVTGEDLLRETITESQRAVELSCRLGFGRADVVVAVPQFWLDVRTMNDLDEVSVDFYRSHGHRLRVATKYHQLTRRFFADKGVRGYRLVDSLGATEAAPAAGVAEIIVDITSTGSTLKANHLSVLDDGVVLRSEAVLASSLAAEPGPQAREAAATLLKAIGRA